VSKAWGAIGMGESSRHLGTRLKEMPAFLGALSDMSGGKVVPVAGGVLIMDGESIIGAAGASGATADEDEACVVAGIKAAGLEYKFKAPNEPRPRHTRCAAPKKIRIE
jgi:uncharacterized protein GlcG (DUF336 family)